MSYDVQFETLEAKHYIGVRRSVGVTEIAEALGEMLPATFGLIESHAIVPAGPPVTIYFAYREAEGEFDMLGGFFTHGMVDAPEGFESGLIPGGDIAFVVHEGPYEQLGNAHEAVVLALDERGRKAGSPCWDTYLNDPAEVSLEAIRTRVTYLLEREA